MTTHPASKAGPVACTRGTAARAATLALACLSLVLGATMPLGASSPIPAGFDQVSVLGTDSVLLQKDSTVASGDVVGNNADALVTISMNAATAADYAVRSDVIDLKNGVVPAGSYFCNTLDSHPSVSATCSPQGIPVFATLPDFVSATANANDQSVANNASATLAPAAYGALDVGKDATLTLGPGIYDFAAITTGNGASILFDGPTTVRVAGQVFTGHDNVIGPAATPSTPVTAAEIVFFVSGTDDEDADAVHFGKDTTVDANVYAPNGTVRLKGTGNGSPSTTLNGAILAQHVVLEGGTTVTLDTNFRNLPPIAVDDGILVSEGGSATTLIDGVTTSVLANDSDPNNDNLSVTPFNGALTNGVLDLLADGTFTYTHDGSETTVDSFVYEVCDDGVAPGPLCSNATVAITITPVNDPPVAVDDTFTVDEGATTTNGGASLFVNDTDAEGNNLSLGSFTAPAHASAFTLNLDGTFSYTHDGSETLTDSFTYQVCDDGTDPPGPQCSVLNATVSIIINPVNDDPVGNDQTITVGLPTTITMTGSDPEGDALTFSILTPPPATEGTLGPVTPIDATSASVLFTPGVGSDGDAFDTGFVFQVADGNGGFGTGNVTITVLGSNSPPVTRADAIRVNNGGTATTLINGLTSLLANDFDPDGDGLTLQAAPVSGPSNGSVTLNANGTFSYTHDGSATTTDAFVYQVCDDGSPSLCSNGQANVQVLAGSITVTLTFLGDGAGSVASSPAGLSCTETTVPCTATITSPDRIDLIGTPAPGSAFAGFGGDPDCSDGTLLVDTNKNCTVTFNAVPPPPSGFFNLTVSSTGTGSGTITSFPAGINCGADCLGVFPALTRVELIPTAAPGSTFVNWNGTADCLDGLLIRNPGDDANCVAVFDAIVVPPSTSTLTVVVNGDGTVRSSTGGITCTADSTCSEDVATGDVVTLFARGSSGAFVGWSGACVGSSPIVNVTVDAAKTCTATFSP